MANVNVKYKSEPVSAERKISDQIVKVGGVARKVKCDNCIQ